jgi:hypothetical protein
VVQSRLISRFFDFRCVAAFHYGAGTGHFLLPIIRVIGHDAERGGPLAGKPALAMASTLSTVPTQSSANSAADGVGLSRARRIFAWTPWTGVVTSYAG